jgi:hypothetical protein
VEHDITAHDRRVHRGRVREIGQVLLDAERVERR